MNAGSRVESVRLELGMSQEHLAASVRKLGGNVTQTGIDKIEKRDAMRPRCLPEIAEVLGVNEEWLMHGRGEKKRGPSFDRELARLPESESRRIIAILNDLIRAAKLRGKVGNGN